MSIFDADDLVTSTLAPVITIRPEIRTMNRLKKTRYIPANAEAREFPQGACPRFCVTGPQAGDCHLTRRHHEP
nr:hypothetical protein [Xanthomonas phaseoli pv. phaseoli]MDM4810674.1 hypothetical protein [Xanthomonas phaseoli pv. phaseoli]